MSNTYFCHGYVRGRARARLRKQGMLEMLDHVVPVSINADPEDKVMPHQAMGYSVKHNIAYGMWIYRSGIKRVRLSWEAGMNLSALIGTLR